MFNTKEKLKKEKQVIIKNIGFNLLLFFGASFYGVAFLLGGFDELSANISSAQVLFDKEQTMYKSGLSTEDLQTLLRNSKQTNSAALAKMLSRPEQKKEITAVIKKENSFSGTYIDWLNDKLDKLDELKKQGKYANSILGNIIPTFTSVAGNSEVLSLKDGDTTVVGDQIDMTRFVKYFEQNLLKQYNISSDSKIGINSVEFKTGTKSNAGGSIGSFVIPLEFKGKNRDILNFIKAIQDSGRIPADFFGQKGTDFWKSIPSTSEGFSQMNNLLITIDSLNLESVPNVNLGWDNKGSIKLRFYVKGIGVDDVIDIRKAVSDMYDKLQKETVKQVTQFWAYCSSALKKDTCSSQEVMQSESALKWLSSQILLDIKAQADALKTFRLTSEADASELDKVGVLYSRYKDYESQLIKNGKILSSAMKAK